MNGRRVEIDGDWSDSKVVYWKRLTDLAASHDDGLIEVTGRLRGGWAGRFVGPDENGCCSALDLSCCCAAVVRFASGRHGCSDACRVLVPCH
ncbi:MAG TPA: hypothetical protein D7H92_03015, partial [Candidatus Poseidoniales archaeon]